jgi:acyl-CoA synthetase (AMP-forming)/AMP-acid ligase II
MRESTREFFLNINIFLQNCYGMSELSGPQCITDKMGWDTYKSKEFLREAGRCFPGLELIIDNPDAEGHGEICLRGSTLLIQEGIASWVISKMKVKREGLSTIRALFTQGMWG